MNWLIKWAQISGYLAEELGGGWNLMRWEDKEAELTEQRDILRKKAEEIAESLGHILKPWSNINSTHCKKCSRMVRLFSVNGGVVIGSPGHEGGRIQGRGVMEACKGQAMTPYDLPDDWLGLTRGWQKL